MGARARGYVAGLRSPHAGRDWPVAPLFKRVVQDSVMYLYSTRATMVRKSPDSSYEAVMPKYTAIISLAIFISLSGISCLAEDPAVLVPACQPTALDVYALPPVTSLPVPRNHLLVFEVQNIGKTGCSLDSPAVRLTPSLGPRDQEYDAIKYLSDGSSTDGVFDETILSPGDWVHALVVWPSQGLSKYPNAGCVEHSGLDFQLMHKDRGMQPVIKTSVEVRNVQMRSCVLVYVSEYRKGRYTASSVVPEDWLRGFGPDRDETYPVPANPTSLQILRDPSLLQISSSLPRILVGEFFWLSLKRSSKAENGCEYRMLRKRESDGTTVISLQNCEEDVDAADKAPAQSAGLKQTFIDPGSIGMQPMHPGSIAYDAISNIGRPDAPSWVESHIDLIAHDPTPPAQAAILDALPRCTDSQLEIVPLAPSIAIPGTTLQAYEATNTSSEACAVAGVPYISIQLTGKMPCPNCVNNLFAVRPNGRIDLQPGQEAHFLAGTEFHSEDGDYWSECQPAGSFEFGLLKDDKSLKLPFAGGACGTLDVSAWREGKFDSDPMNLRWAKTHPVIADPTTAIPRDCDKPELLTRGRPMMIPMGKDLSFGLSLAQHEFKAGEDITLHVWVDNTGNEKAGVWTCMGLDYFKANGFDLYDAFGHRVLRRDEAKRQEKCSTDPHVASHELGWSCARNFPIYIPAHTCVTRDEYDFTTGLTAAYDLPPGEYTVLPHQGEPEDLCRPQKGGLIRAEPGKDLTFSVIQP